MLGETVIPTNEFGRTVTLRRTFAPLSEAETVAEVEIVGSPLERINVTRDVPPGTVTEGGTVSIPLSDDREIGNPAAGATVARRIVPTVVWLPYKLLAVDNDFRRGAATLIAADEVELFRDANRVTVPSVATGSVRIMAVPVEAPLPIVSVIGTVARFGSDEDRFTVTVDPRVVFNVTTAVSFVPPGVVL